MTEVQRDLHILISIAKLDASLNAARTELALLPERVGKIESLVADMEAREAEAKAQVESMAKERRTLEQQLEDNSEKVKKFRTHLMEVKTNKEYTAVLHEIEHIDKDTEVKEERLLVLLDEFDQESAQNNALVEESKKKKAELAQDKAQLDERIKTLQEEMRVVGTEKPKLLIELDPRLRKRYDRILAKLHDFAVTHVIDETCQGCFARIPPQIAVEVKKNDAIITCEACGRMLVYYIT
jgi:predicted  nucleic acid-binding Zn-ribbon protein